MRWLMPAALLTACPAAAQEREFSTDRPDRTESPFTVPAGSAQIELDLATYTRDRSGGTLTESVSVAPINLKFGVADNADLQVVLSPYVRQRQASGRAVRTIDGIGDVTIRFKRNLIGNDGGTVALGIMPFVTLPTAREGLGAGFVEGGVILPVSVGLTKTLSLGAMSEVDLTREDRDHYAAAFVNSAALGVALSDRIGVYSELYTERNRNWIVTGDLGLTIRTDDVTQFDVGANIGLNRAADDLTVFAGFARRF